MGSTKLAGSEILLRLVLRAGSRLQGWLLVYFGFFNTGLDNTATDDVGPSSKFFEAGYQSLNCRASRPLRDSGDGQGWLCRSSCRIRGGMYFAFDFEVCLDTSNE